MPIENNGALRWDTIYGDDPDFVKGKIEDVINKISESIYFRHSIVVSDYNGHLFQYFEPLLRQSGYLIRLFDASCEEKEYYTIDLDIMPDNYLIMQHLAIRGDMSGKRGQRSEINYREKDFISKLNDVVLDFFFGITALYSEDKCPPPNLMDLEKILSRPDREKYWDDLINGRQRLNSKRLTGIEKTFQKEIAKRWNVFKCTSHPGHVEERLASLEAEISGMIDFRVNQLHDIGIDITREDDYAPCAYFYVQDIETPSFDLSVKSVKTTANGQVVTVDEHTEFLEGSTELLDEYLDNNKSRRGFFVVSDPNGALWQKYSDHFKKQGFAVRRFMHGELKQDVSYCMFIDDSMAISTDNFQLFHLLHLSLRTPGYSPLFPWAENNPLITAMLLRVTYGEDFEEKQQRVAGETYLGETGLKGLLALVNDYMERLDCLEQLDDIFAYDALEDNGALHAESSWNQFKMLSVEDQQTLVANTASSLKKLINDPSRYTLLSGETIDLGENEFDVPCAYFLQSADVLSYN